MWIVLARRPAREMPYWVGRRWVAVLDAIAWPVLCVLCWHHFRAATGVVGTLLGATAVFAGLLRIQTAIWRNECYRFTTWLLGRILVTLLVFGLLFKIFGPFI
jgi:uncharacterized membrane protein HdeD (DUF308 family)